MHLTKVDTQLSPLSVTERLFGRENGITRLIAAAGTLINSPRRFVLAIDGIVDGTCDAFLVGLVVEIRFQITFGIGIVGSGGRELHLLFHRSRTFGPYCGFDFDSELSQRTGSLE